MLSGLQNRRRVAPSWNTALLLAYLLFPISLIPGAKTWISRLSGLDLPWIYVIDLYWLWTAFAIVFVGLALSGTRILDLLDGGSPAKRDLAKHIGPALAAWIVLVVLAVSMYLLFGPFGSSAHRLLPITPFELLLFLPLAFTAGFCEELIFRGYFLQQFFSYTGSTVAALCLQAAIFSLAHGHNQTAAGFADKFIAGLVFGMLALWRKSLVPCIMAHVWLDFSPGILSVLTS